MEDFEKKQLEKIAQQKEYLHRKEVLLDDKILAIQQSTKTSFKLFNALHNKLRAKWKWYYKWHINPFSNFVHFLLVLIIAGSFATWGASYYLGGAIIARAAEFSSVATGDWNNPCTWNISCVSPIPGDGSFVTIKTGTEVTVSANISVSSLSVDDSATAKLTISSGKMLTTNGAVVIGAAGSIGGSGTLELVDGAGAQLSPTGILSSKVRFNTTSGSVSVPARTYGGTVEFYNSTDNNYSVNLLGGTHNYSANFNPIANGNGNITIDASANPTVNISGDMDYTGSGSGNETIIMGNGTWTISGSWHSDGTSLGITTNSGTVIMNGNGKSMSGCANTDYFNNLKISGIITLENSGQLGVNHDLTIDSGANFTINRDFYLGSGASSNFNGNMTGSGSLIAVGTSGSLINGSGIISPALVDFVSQNSNITVLARQYNTNIQFRGTDTISRTITIGNGPNQTLVAEGNIFVKANNSGDITFDAASNNPSIIAKGGFKTNGTGTGSELINMGSGKWTVYGDVDLSGSTVTPGTSTLDLARMTGTQQFTASGQTVGNMTHTGAGTLKLLDTTSVGNLTLGQTYAKQKTITVDHTKVGATTEDEVNFPMLVSLTDNDLKLAPAGSVTNTNGYDIIFVDSNGVKLDHEIEKYDATTGELIMWVRIPLLSKTSDTVITMLYGNSSVTTSQENKAGVWMNGYAAVYHLKETSGQHNDSTINANNSNTVTMTTQGSAAGKIGGSDACNGTTDYIGVPNSSSLNFEYNQNFTISLWLDVPFTNQPDTSAAGNEIISKHGPSNFPYTIRYNNQTSGASDRGKLAFNSYDGSHSAWIQSATTVNDNQFHYINYTKNGGTVFAYIDNSQTGTGTDTNTGTVINTSDLNICRRSQQNNVYMNAKIDEVRLSSAARSAGWISTEYANQNSPDTFYPNLPASTATSPTINLNSQALNVGGNFSAASSAINQAIQGVGLTFNSNSTAHTITTNGYTMPTVSFSGTSGSSLADNFTTSGNITINSGATLNTYVNSNSYNVNCVNMIINGTGVLYSGTNKSSGDSIFTVSGNWTAADGNRFTYGKSKVYLTETSTITSGVFYDLYAAAASKTISLGSNLGVYHVLTLDSGIWNGGGYYAYLYGGGSPFAPGTATISSGTIAYSGTGDKTVASASYKGLFFECQGTYTATAGGDITVNADFTMKSYSAVQRITFDTAGKTITIKGKADLGGAGEDHLDTFKPTGSGAVTITGNFTNNYGTVIGRNIIDLSSYSGMMSVGGNLINSDTITAGNVTLNISGSVTNNAGGVINAGTSTWNVGDGNGTDDWTNNGTFNYDQSTVDMQGTGRIITNSSFYNLIASAANKNTTLSAGANVYNDLTLGTGTLTANWTGLFMFKNGGTPFNNQGVHLNTDHFTLEYCPTSGTVNVTGGDYGSMNKLELFPRGPNTVFNLSSDLTLNSGTVFIAHSTSSSGNTIVNTQDHKISAIGILIGESDATKGVTFNAGNSLIDIGTGGLVVGNNGGTTHILNLNSATITNKGDWKLVNGTGSIAQSGDNSIVTFNGTANGQTITSNGQAFYNLAIANTHADGVTFADDAAISGTLTATDSNVKKITVTAGKTLNVASLNIEGNHSTRLALRSSADGQAWNLTGLAGSKTVSYVDVKDSHASSEIIASESKDSTGNNNWMLVKTLTFDIHSTTGHVQEATAATITAKDGTGADTNAIGDGITLSADHGTISPALLTSANFTNGSWGGNITLSYVGTVTVTALLHGLSAVTDTITLSPGALDHFTVTGVSASVVVQSPFTSPVVVTAYDSYGNVKIDYTGSMYFISTDNQAILPYTSGSKFTFTGSDAGFHSFLGVGFTLKTTGTQTISATDGSITNASSNIVVTPAGLGSFAISGIDDLTTITAGQTFGSTGHNVTITALDTFGNTKTDYVGAVWFASTDTKTDTILPAQYQFLAGDNGIHQFSGDNFKLTTTGNQTITLTDGPGGGTDATSENILVTPANLDHFGLTDYPQAANNQFVTAGYDWSTGGDGGGTNAPYNVTVTAYDQYGNVKTNYNDDPIWFTYGNAGNYIEPDQDKVLLPCSSAENTCSFDEADKGVHTFDANTFKISTASSNMKFTVHSSSGKSSDFYIKIKPASIASFRVTFSAPLSTYPVDTPLAQNVVVEARDISGNVKTDYDGSIYFTSTDTSATLPYTETGLKYQFDAVNDSGSKVFDGSNFTFHSGGIRTLSVVGTLSSTQTDTTAFGNSDTFTISAHAPTELQSTAGHHQVTLDWKNATDEAVYKVNIYRWKDGEDPAFISSALVRSNDYSQYVDSGLENGTNYHYYLKSVVNTQIPDTPDYESSVSATVSAVPADIAARSVSASQLTTNGSVQIEYYLRYNSNVSIEYYDPDKTGADKWSAASSEAQSGDVGDQTGSQDLVHHTAYWNAKKDFPEKYFNSSQGFKVRIKVNVADVGTGVTPSASLSLDTKNPSNTSLIIDASGDSKANLSIRASDDSGAPIMMVSNNQDFQGASYRDYAESITDWNLENSDTVYIRFKDRYQNTTDVSTKLIPIVENFMLKDNSDLRTPAYQMVISWADTTISNFDKYIVERRADNGDFEKLVETKQPAFLDIKLDKNTLYGYRIKVVDANGNISRPSQILSSMPGLAPDITAVPTTQIFGYRQDIGVKVIVKWNTDQMADSFVAFSTDELNNDPTTTTKSGSNANLIGQLDRSQTHEVTITNLLPGKKYYMKALSQNDQKITGFSDVFEINTPEYIPLQIKGLDVSELQTSSAWISWQTNKASKTNIVLSDQTGKFDRSVTDTTLNTDHKFKLENLTPGSEYRLKIEATDEDGNVVTSDEYKFASPADPEVSEVSVTNILNNSATVTWKSNVNTDSNVEYGPSNSYGAQSGKSDLTTQHSVSVVGLDANTTYHFRAKSKDVFSNEAFSSDLTFTTISDTTPPVLSEIQSQLSQVSSPQGPKYQAVISWKTDEGATSQIEFGENAGGKYSKKTQEDASLNVTHVVILSDLKPNAAYSYRIISKDKAGNEARSTNYTIITPPQEQSLVKIVLSNLEDTFSWVGKLRTKWFHN